MSPIHDIDTGSTTQDTRIWIALYTRARHEVSIARQISGLGIETFVPICREMHCWSDRKKWIEIPLIPSYVFVHIDLRDYFRILTVQGIVHPVMFHGRIAHIRDHEIELLRYAEKSKDPLPITTPDYHAMDDVEVIAGLFIGHRGKVVQSGLKYKISIRIEELEYAIVVELSKADIRLTNQAVAAV
jgi:transcriptional antiterminator RfaH